MRTTDTLNIIAANTKVLVGPLALLVVLLLLFVFALRIGIGQIISLSRKVAESKVEEQVLTEKLEILKTSEDSALPLADLSLVAIPAENPALIVISQLKNLAGEKGVGVSNIEAKETAAFASIFHADIEVTVDGEIGPLFDFLKGLGSISPLLTLDQVIIRQESGITKVQALIFGNFAPLPTTLPSITSPLDELTAEEKDILAKISSYSQPVFSEVTPSGPFERVDLFNF